MFREKVVRLIAVEDNFDSDKGEYDITPIKEIFSEMFAHDTSRKIKSVLRNKGRDGKPLGSVPLYSYAGVSIRTKPRNLENTGF